MMQILRDDWIALLNETRHSTVDENAPNIIVCDDKIVIDDILLYSNHIPTLLHCLLVLLKFLQSSGYHLNYPSVFF